MPAKNTITRPPAYRLHKPSGRAVVRLNKRDVCRDALNGYQKGKCFYCLGEISVEANSDGLAEVDHFHPHILKQHGFGEPIDGVWNLVLACQICNRGKGAQLPDLRFLERLHKRNSYFINSHHPLRETLIQQTGASIPARTDFLQATYDKAKKLLGRTWKPDDEHGPAF